MQTTISKLKAQLRAYIGRAVARLAPKNRSPLIITEAKKNLSELRRPSRVRLRTAINVTALLREERGGP